jgi:hypothetical protein
MSRFSIYLVNGIKLQGQIESFDQYVVLLKNTGHPDGVQARHFDRGAGPRDYPSPFGRAGRGLICTICHAARAPGRELGVSRFIDGQALNV